MSDAEDDAPVPDDSPDDQPDDLIDAQLIITTFPDAEVAARIARALVSEGLAACVNLVPGARSIYRWQGAVEESAELIGLVKTTFEATPRLIARLVELHPYDMPEAIVLEISSGHPPYLAWLTGAVTAR